MTCECVEAETYRQMHETARELGYPSILEALEALARLSQPSDGVTEDYERGFNDALEKCAQIGDEAARKSREIAVRKAYAEQISAVRAATSSDRSE